MLEAHPWIAGHAVWLLVRTLLGSLAFVLAWRRGFSPVYWGAFAALSPVVTFPILLTWRPSPAPERPDRAWTRILSVAALSLLLLVALLPSYASFMSDKAEQWAGEGAALSPREETAVRIASYQVRYGFLGDQALVGLAALLRLADVRLRRAPRPGAQPSVL